MTRRRRKKIAGALKLCLLLTLPLAIGAGARTAAGIRKELVQSERSAETALAGKRAGEAEEMKRAEVEPPREELLDGAAFLSEGYGVTEEVAAVTVAALPSPLETASDAPGDKPYPRDDEWGGGGSVIRTTYQKYSGTAFFDLEGGGQVNNKTDIPNEKLISESRILPDIEFSSGPEPQVLIYHTHTCESYEPYVREEFDVNFNFRTTDETKNVVMVGDAIQTELEARGVGVIHVRTIHDYPSYNGAYDRSRASIQPILEQYPSIKLVLDIHRDAIGSGDVAYQPVANVGGKEAAQIMIISGCDDGTMGMPLYMKNFHLACALQRSFEKSYPGLTRPILFDYRCYNQDLTTGSLLIEVGSHGSTLEQAQYSGQLIGAAIGETIRSAEAK